jgi:hypothetical protein
VNKNWFLLHSNAPVHAMFIVQKFLSQKGVTEIRPAPSSSDLAVADFFLFPKLNMKVEGDDFIQS